MYTITYKITLCYGQEAGSQRCVHCKGFKSQNLIVKTAQLSSIFFILRNNGFSNLISILKYISDPGVGVEALQHDYVRSVNWTKEQSTDVNSWLFCLLYVFFNYYTYNYYHEKVKLCKSSRRNWDRLKILLDRLLNKQRNFSVVSTSVSPIIFSLDTGVCVIAATTLKLYAIKFSFSFQYFCWMRGTQPLLIFIACKEYSSGFRLSYIAIINGWVVTYCS